MAPEKVDLYKIYGDEYIAPKSPQFIRNLSARYLTISGRGELGEEVFLARIELLYAVALTIKKQMKESGTDYDLFVSEALLWGTTQGADFLSEPLSDWNWKILLRVPHVVMEEDRMTTIMQLMDQGHDPAISEVKLETLKEGLCVQYLHKGPITDIAESTQEMLVFAAERKTKPHGFYHQIYLTDPRKTAPEKMQTILRIPVQ